jgi:hypothetical protein
MPIAAAAKGIPPSPPASHKRALYKRESVPPPPDEAAETRVGPMPQAVLDAMRKAVEAERAAQTASAGVDAALERLHDSMSPPAPPRAPSVSPPRPQVPRPTPKVRADAQPVAVTEAPSAPSAPRVVSEVVPRALSEAARIVPEIPPPPPVPTRASRLAQAAGALTERGRLLTIGLALYVVCLGGIVALGIALGRFILSML